MPKKVIFGGNERTKVFVSSLSLFYSVSIDNFQKKGLFMTENFLFQPNLWDTLKENSAKQNTFSFKIFLKR